MSGTAQVVSRDTILRAVGGVTQCVGLACVALLWWRSFTRPVDAAEPTVIGADGSLTASAGDVVRAAGDSQRVTLRGVPTARARAVLRALRASGRTVQITTPTRLPTVAVGVEEQWRAIGGARMQVAIEDSVQVAVRDAAGALDTMYSSPSGSRRQLGPVQGALTIAMAGSTAAAPAVAASAPDAARVLVLGDATWESRFLVAAFEEAGWPVDVAVSLAPRVTVAQGSERIPSRTRHAIVVVLPGATSAALAALPAFVRGGGGVVVVGDAARQPALRSLLVGTVGPTRDGELGAEASDEPRHGLELVPISSLTAGSVPIEIRNGVVAVAARRVGAGRVVQVGYANSWLWRMAGNDDAPAAHRRWWSALLSGVVAQRAPVSRLSYTPEHDTLDAAPIAALARDLGVPRIGAEPALSPATSLAFRIDTRWLLLIGLLSFVSTWTLRRWRGFI
jgi:hypothetical protein